MTLRTRRGWIFAVVAAVCTALVLALYAIPVLPVLKIELMSQDLRAQIGRKTTINTNLVFVGLEQSGYSGLFSDEEIRESPLLAHMAAYPFPRMVWAGIIERLANAGAKVIALDFVFAGPKEGDEELRRAVETHSNRVVLAANLTGRKENLQLLTPDPSLLAGFNPRADPRVGFINVWEDRDGVVRSATFNLTQSSSHGLLPFGETMESFAARIVRLTGEQAKLPRDAQPRVIRFCAPPREGYPPLPLYSLLLKNHWEQNYGKGEFFRNKIVVIGPAANIMQDFHLVPLARITADENTGETLSDNSMPGPEIHLNIVAAALAGELIREMRPAAGAWITGIAAVIAWILSWVIRGPFPRLLVSFVVSAAFCGLAQLLFDRWNYVVFLVAPLAVFNATTLGGFIYDFVLERREKNRTRRTLERYVSKDVVREVLDNPQTYLNTLGGVRKPVTILFSDVRGFTTMTESADEAQLVSQLNEYFNEMVGIVFAHHGSLDKFIGDAVMALWGSITSQGIERDAQHAVAAALEMRRALARLNISWKQRGMQELSFGIGINHGTPIVGNLGSEQKMEVSVIGDAVNLASRLEGLTKEYKLDLLLGESLAPLVENQFVLRAVDSVQVKGKTKPVRVFTVVTDRESGEQPPAWLVHYDRGIEFYRRRAFAESAQAFSECLRAVPDDYLAQLYHKRCTELIANPPGTDWDTVFIMKSK